MHIVKPSAGRLLDFLEIGFELLGLVETARKRLIARPPLTGRSPAPFDLGPTEGARARSGLILARQYRQARRGLACRLHPCHTKPPNRRPVGRMEPPRGDARQPGMP